MNNLHITIWEREFDLELNFQNYPGEDVTDLQRQTIEAVSSVDFMRSRQSVEEFLIKKNPDFFQTGSVDNIFKYVMPKSILIQRDKNNRSFSIMCNYKFDMEHGLAVVFENEEYKAVGTQDLVL